MPPRRYPTEAYGNAGAAPPGGFVPFTPAAAPINSNGVAQNQTAPIAAVSAAAPVAATSFTPFSPAATSTAVNAPPTINSVASPPINAGAALPSGFVPFAPTSTGVAGASAAAGVCGGVAPPPTSNGHTGAALAPPPTSPLAPPPVSSSPFADDEASDHHHQGGVGHLPPSHQGGHRHYPVDPESQSQLAPTADVGGAAAPKPMHMATNAGVASQAPSVVQPVQVGSATVPVNASNAAEAKSQANSEAQCHPDFLRMTYSCFPNSSDLQTRAGIPLGAVIHPLSPVRDVPLVNFGRLPIPRCRSCRSYINPFVTWLENGRRWRCNFCLLANEVPSEYMCTLRDGERADVDQRAELRTGLVEFVAPSEYMVRAPQPPCYVFVIDVSYASVSGGVLAAVAAALKRGLPVLDEQTRANVSLITFDDTVHCYSFKRDGSAAEMHVMIDIDDPFPPRPSGLVVRLADVRTAFGDLADALPRMFAGNKAAGSAAGAALTVAYRAARHIGGKIMLYQTGLVAKGVGTMPNRQALGADPHKLLQSEGTAAQFFKTLALDISRAQLAVDVHLFGSQFCDVASFNCLPQITGGELRRYTSVVDANVGNAEPFIEQVSVDLERTLARETSLEAVMRVRCSKGLTVSQYHGNLFVRSTDLLALPNADADKAFALQFKVSDLTSRTAAVQAALLYTTTQGQRRIRVLTISLPVVSQLAPIFKSADLDAVVNIMTKMAIKKSVDSSLADAREALVNKCVDILAVYRRAFASPQTPPTQLVLPETLKGLPLSVLALIKSAMLRSGMDVTADERAALMARLRTAPLDLTRAYAHPRLFDIEALVQQRDEPLEAGDSLPATLGVSAEHLRRNGAFLLDDGLALRLWLGRDVTPALADELIAGAAELGIEAPGALRETAAVEDRLPLLRRPVGRVRVRGDGATPLLDGDNKRSVGAHFAGLLELLRDSNAWAYQPVRLAREGVDGNECAEFVASLVEDRTANVFSYFEFLVKVQAEVTSKLK
jgi:protein transport protein SEC24